MTWRVEEADCIEAMREMGEASVDAIVTDPPYFLAFMGQSWDTVSAGEMQREHEAWAREALRVLRPGGHLLAFGGTRTSHRLACAIEDAGFEIRDTIAWMYGSGFPKSLDVSKAIDKAAGAEREVVGYDASRARPNRTYEGGAIGNIGGTGKPSDRTDNGATFTAPATPEAERWQGWGTALKPAHEPIVVARKPLSGTVAQTVLEHGTGALNVDGCRVGATGGTTKGNPPKGPSNGIYGDGINGACEVRDIGAGRWPANVVLSHTDGCEPVGTRRVKTSSHSQGVMRG